MFPPKALLSLFLVGLTVVDASPVSRSTCKTVNFSARINEGGTLSFVEKDRAHARALKNLDSESVTKSRGAIYYTSRIGVGNPPAFYTLEIDAQSPVTWVGASRPYRPTSTSRDTGNNISLSYAGYYMTGTKWRDTVTLTHGLVVDDQLIGVVSSMPGIEVDGVLGLGSASHGTCSVPTVVDNMLFQGTISQEMFGLYLVPSSEWLSTGEVTFGAYDHSVITSAVDYVSFTQTPPSSQFWGFDQSISYGCTTILSTTAGIVDPGTTFIYLATDAYLQYAALANAFHDCATGLLAIDPSRYSDLQTLSFEIGGKEYDLSPDAQVWPRALNHVFGGSPDVLYLVVADLGSPSGEGLDFIMGYAFLERFYSVFDSTNGQIGFATTVHTDAIIN